MLHKLLRPQSSLRGASSLFQKPVSALPQRQIRGIHRVPQLTHDASFKKKGIPELLSPEAVDFAWTQYQTLLIDKLNLLTQDTVDANVPPGELLVKYSRRPEMASVFNYASMAHNNHFFFNCLSPAPTQIPDKFAKDIIDTCSSVESLKLDFLATANAMFGPGFVWLAKNLEREGLMHIFCTYNAGSPYPAAHSRRQPVDMSTHSPDAPLGNQYAGAMGAHSANATNQKTMAPGAIDVQPILCVNTWEHVWMMDYGIAGKAEYLERWWDRINWEAVFANYTAVSSVKAAPGGNWNRNLNSMV
ncbi:manganese and iron superoxide dismutase [Aspergillus campestris IBT 28561]|uniref:Manganese and iron superoxide dismutase n=1 Tax=Aspergillus campestris (strain IBT 28561) TaxID=1392248 RepID=A0A2I1CY17_ASPC2|nr:manganese and iron superoxide dismutase [Aspergillus campestris IBT 28561]PKY02504.1 manganese and iron superoxide dismutase [Aspergillus campestris IBT 28561]